MSADELEEFFAEARELMGAAEQALLALEAGGLFAQQYDAMFRAFHTIKGMAGMTDQMVLQQHLHQLETILVQVKSNSSLSRGYVDFFLRGCDATNRIIDGQTVEFDYDVSGLEGAPPPGSVAKSAFADEHDHGEVPPPPEPSAVAPEATDTQSASAASAVPQAARAVVPSPDLAAPPPPSLAAPEPTSQIETPPSGDKPLAVAAEAAVKPADLAKDAAAKAAWDKVDELLKQSAGGHIEVTTRVMDAESIDFLNECDEAVQRVCDGLLKVEKGEPTDAKLVDAVYRDVHSIKGGAQLFNMPNLASMTHALENVLDYIRRQKRPFEAKEVDPILNLMTTVQQWVNTMREGPKAKAAAPTAGAPAAIAAGAAAATVGSGAAAAGSGAPAGGGSEAKPGGGGDASDSSVRVPVALLDKLMASMGEMVLVRNQVLQFANRSDDFEFLRMSQRLDIVTSEIQGEVMKTRMQPIGNVLGKFQRIVRDLSKSLNKRIDLVLAGTETELDKTLLEAVKDPLMHIVRNSCDHGLETPEQRRAMGKTEAGKILIKAYQEGGQVVIEVSDDGRGLDREKLLKKGIEKKLVNPDRAFSMTDREVYGLIFAAGFSTAAQVTNVSGRGVGMDVVKSNIEKIGGLIELESRPNNGMTIRLKIPLTLAILPAMIVRSENDRYAIPQLKVVELLRIEPGDGSVNRIDTLQGKPIFRLRGILLPLLGIKEILGMPEPEPRQQLADGKPINIVVVRAERQMFGIMVEDVQDKADIVVKPLSPFLKSVTSYCGATVLGDGAIALILDIVGIAQRHNLGLHENALSENEDGDLARREKLEAQEFLLFRIDGRKERHAVPLNLVHRLEEVRPQDIESAGEQSVLRYRGVLLPILNLGQALGYHAGQAETESNAVMRVIVVKKSNRLFGFHVGDILDVLSTMDPMDDGPTTSPLLLGNIMTKDGIVIVADILRVVEEYVRTLAPPVPVVVVDPAGETKEIRVLFAEDTTFFRKHVKSVLEKAGYRVDTAINGLEALQKLESVGAGPKGYQFLLSDIEMPEMDGLSLMRSVRASELLSKMPAIALTTRFSPENISDGKAAGFDDYMEKMNAEALLASMQRLLATRGIAVGGGAAS